MMLYMYATTNPELWKPVPGVKFFAERMRQLIHLPAIKTPVKDEEPR